MRSAEAAAWHWFQISSHLQQKHGRKRIDHGCSESLSATVKTAAARVGAILPLCPRPSLARRWLSGIRLGSSSHRWPPCTTTGQHNFSGNYIRWRCFIRCYIFISQAPLGIDSLKYLPKSCLDFVFYACNTVWTVFLILCTQHKRLFFRTQVSIFFYRLPLNFFLIYLKNSMIQERTGFCINI